MFPPGRHGGRPWKSCRAAPSVVFADGQMGASANFFLKDRHRRALRQHRGDLTATRGLWRLDGFSGFKLADSWYGSVGGFWRESDGVRDPQFKADKGGQLTATLSHETDAGKFTLYSRYLNDKNQFITPIPLIQRGTRQLQRLSGLRPAEGHVLQQGHAARVPAQLSQRRHQTPTWPTGAGAKMFFLGGNFDYQLEKRLVDQRPLPVSMPGDMDTNALFSGNNPASLADMLYNPNHARRLQPAGRFGHRHLHHHRWRGAAGPERDPAGLVAYPQAPEELQQRLPPESANCSKATR